ncbi:MAG: tripartite tricarboxylate transporter substrate binding protein [Betaproteobacteria bacterium]|nr:tripartite tricarboxylate transporter substrate binding protein [Betaproteobacteria bacterium]
MSPYRRAALRIGLTAFALIWAGLAAAQKYPDHPIRYVVTDQPGSNIDALARTVSEKLSTLLGQQVVVDNRAGAGGNIGADIGAHSPPDGYTIVQLASTHAVNASLYKNLPYNMLRDFTPISQLAYGPSVVVVPANSPFKTIADLIKAAKEKAGNVQYASAGTGTCTFLAAELFKQQAGVDMMHIPYKGGGPAITSIIAGETQVYFAPLAPSLPQIRQGRMRALAVTSDKPLPQLPDVPTLKSAGMPQYGFSCWYGMLAPAGTPKPIIATLNKAVVAALNDAVVKKRLIEMGFVPVGDQPEEFGTYIRSEIEAGKELTRSLPPPQ